LKTFAVGASCAKGHGVKVIANNPAYWLFKEEPDHYSFADLERDGATVWNGVTNNLARQNLRKVRPGDRVLYYHTGKEKAVVGVMEVTGGPMPDPESEDPKSVVVKVKPLSRLSSPVTLERIKGDSQLAGWDLVRLPRLSVMPVSAKQWQRVQDLSCQDEA
jgi:predicted RNA-binding protein with PUA-like domain